MGRREGEDRWVKRGQISGAIKELKIRINFLKKLNLSQLYLDESYLGLGIKNDHQFASP